MARVADLPHADPLAGNEFLPVVQDGQTKRVDYDDLAGPVRDAVQTIADAVSGDKAAIELLFAADARFPNSVADGLADAAEGEPFVVYEDGFLNFYRKVSGAASFIDGLELASAITARRVFGRDRVFHIPTNLDGSLIPSTGSPIAADSPTLSADTVLLAGGKFPPGMGFLSYQVDENGDLVTPGAGKQSAYRDARYLGRDENGNWVFWNAGSDDYIIDPAFPVVDGSPPRTAFRLSICFNDDQAQEVLRAKPYGDQGETVKGGGIWIGSVDANDIDNLFYLPRNGAEPRVFGVTGVQDYAAIFDSRWVNGGALCTRFDLSRGESDDTFANFTVNGQSVAKIRGDGTGVLKRLFVGAESPPIFADSQVHIGTDRNDYPLTTRCSPASGTGLTFGPRHHVDGQTNGDLAIALTCGPGSGEFAAVVTGAKRLGVGTHAPVCAGDFDGPVKVGSYTVGTVPSAIAAPGQQIFVVDDFGGPVLAFSDGTDWRRCTDRAIIST